MKSFYLSLLLLVLGQRLYGQVLTRRATDQDLPSTGKFNASKTAPDPLTLPAPDIARLLKEDAREAGQNVPLKFGQAVPISASPVANGIWENVTGGRVWKFSVASPKAFSLNFFFDKFYLPPGAQLYLYSGDRSIIMGPITEEQNTASAAYATDLIKGDVVVFELFEPKEATGKSQLHLARAVHGYKNLFTSQEQNSGSRYNDSRSCEVDVTCPAGSAWQTESNSVAMVLLGSGDRLCSGSMLNNACQNLVPNFLTAFHCIDYANSDGVISAAEQADVQNWVFRFQYKSTYCGGGEGYSFTSISGAQFLSAFNPTDFALLRLSQRPNPASNIAYAGWTRSANPATSSAGIHHPSGDVMKIALSTSANLPSTWFNNGNTHWRTTFSNGTVEHGSSGSPLFDQNHRVVGQLHGFQEGGDDFCSNHNYYYGRFDMSWNGGGTPETRLSDWLTDDPNVVQVDTRQQPTIAIAGPANWTICTGSTRTVSVANLPPNSTVTWTAGPGIIPSSGSGSSANITGDSGSGNTSITFTITPSSGCGASSSPSSQVTQTMYLNAPDFNLYPSAYTNICAGTPTGVTFAPNSTPPFGDGYFGDPGRSIRWEPAQYVTYGQGTGYATFVRPSNSTPFIISVYLTNTCGTTRKDFYYGTNYNCGSYYRTVDSEATNAYPNPVSETLTIPAGAEGATLLNDKGRKLRTADASGKLDVQSLPEGLYNLQMMQNGKLINQRIQVKH